MPVSIDFGSRFKNCTSYELMGNWPAGLSIDDNGLVTGTPAAQGHYPNLYVKGIGEYNVDYTNGFSMDVTAFGALVPDFNGEMKGVEVGTGDLTTTHTADLYAPDFEGVYRQFGANEAVWSGGRVVSNHYSNSDDVSAQTPQWTALNTVPDASTIIWQAGGGYLQWKTFYGRTLTAGTKLIIRATLSSSDKVQIGFGFAGAISSWLTVTLTATPTVYTTTGVVGTDVLAIDWGFENRTGKGGDQLAGTMTVSGLQFEIVPENQTLPSELIPTSFGDVTTSVATKTFASTNGNTVDGNGVVTEAVGTPLAELPYLSYTPAAQNDQIYSRDLTNGWAAFPGSGFSESYDQVGVTGEPNTASLITDSNASGTEFWYIDSAAFYTDEITGVVYVKKSDSDVPRIEIDFRKGTNATSVYGLNLQTGYLWFASGTAANNTEVVSAGGWWKVLIQQTYTGTKVRPAISPAAYTADDDTSATASLTGSCTVGNVEFHVGKSTADVRGLSPIFTTTAAVATDYTKYSWSVDNAGNADYGVWYFENIPSADAADSSNSNPFLLTVTNNRWLRDYIGAVRTFAVGSSIIASPDCQALANTYRKIGNVYAWPETTHSLNGNGTWYEDTTGTDFDDTFPSTIYLGQGQTESEGPSYAQVFRNLQRYDITSYQDGKDIIDGLMT